MSKKDKQALLEKCVECGEMIGFEEAKDNAEWLEVEIKRPFDEGPVCGPCARRVRANYQRRREYRWEFEEIGMGHYYTQAHVCIREAKEKSLHRPKYTVKVEIWKPRRQLICRFRAGEEI